MVVKIGNLTNSSPGNVGIWKKILEFGGNFVHFLYKTFQKSDACLAYMFTTGESVVLIFKGNRTYWAIPEIKCTPPKEDMGILKILATFFIGKSQKIKHIFGCKGKEDMGIPKIFHHFSTKNGNSQFFTIFDIKNWEFPFLKPFLEFPFFKVKIWACEFPNF